MNNYNPNIHHRRSIRLQGYDYSHAGLYFVTICTHNRECLFGEIAVVVGVENFQPLRPQSQPKSQPQLVLNDAGIIANECWLEIPNHFPNAILHEHIVMPNHVHGIIELLNNVGVENVGVENVGVENVVGVENFQPLPKNEFQKMIPRSIGSIVKGFKIGVTKWIRNHSNIETVWQRNYYEHIIRNEKSYHTISEYIMNNPAKWLEDIFHIQ